MLIDSHCHLDLEQFDTDRVAVLERARTAGVQVIVNPGIDLKHSRQAIALAEAYPEVYAAVGIHPNSSGDFTPATVDQLRSLATHPASTTHRQLSPEELATAGVSPELVRLSIGIEHVDDLLEDIDRAIGAAAGARKG